MSSGKQPPIKRINPEDKRLSYIAERYQEISSWLSDINIDEIKSLFTDKPQSQFSDFLITHAIAVIAEKEFDGYRKGIVSRDGFKEALVEEISNLLSPYQVSNVEIQGKTQAIPSGEVWLN